MDPFIGEIILFAGNFAPRGWALCDGQLMPITSFQALFSILGTTYGGDGVQTFALPDLRGRAPIHPGSGPGLTPYQLGEKSGTESVTLSAGQLPSHNHRARCSLDQGTTNDPTGGYFAVARDNSADDFGSSATKTMNAGFVKPAGGNGSHPNVQPFECVNYIIALEGVYPSRS